MIRGFRVSLIDDKCEPTRSHKWDAGLDLKSRIDTEIRPGDNVKVPLGIKTEIPTRHFGMLVGRSGLGVKSRITLTNNVGIIDSEYRGEICAFLRNDSDKVFTIKKYDRVAQLLIIPVLIPNIRIIDEVKESTRGEGGFGSTGHTETHTKEPDVEVEKMKKRREDAREEAEKRSKEELAALRKLNPAEYMKLKNSGKLFDKFPLATGDIEKDLGE